MEVIEVKSSKDIKEFINLPVRLYKDESNWIRPLDKDIEGVFNPLKNKTFKYGECIRWIVRDGGQTVGRVSAFVNSKTANKDNEQPTGGIGFFESVDNQDVANLLLDTCKTWLTCLNCQL